jgi:alpha-D-xyloside xylohydrolase
LERIPVFIKDGTLLPLAAPLPYVADDAIFDITVRAYGEAPQESLLYEDDGTTFQYRDGRYNWVKLTWEDGVKLERSGGYSGIRYNLVGWEASK